MKAVWDEVGKRLYETGTSKGMLYPQVEGRYPKGVPWNGLISFTESPDGGEATDYYADDIKYVSIRSRENFKGTIGAYMYPDEFAECNGEAALVAGVRIGQQVRKPFGFCYTTKIGNDTQFEDFGYKIHIVYGATAAPSEKNYETVNDNSEPVELNWEIDTLPVAVTGYKPTAHLEIESTAFTTDELKARLTALEDILYGTDPVEGTNTGTDPRLPLPDEIKSILSGTTTPAEDPEEEET